MSLFHDRVLVFYPGTVCTLDDHGIRTRRVGGLDRFYIKTTNSRWVKYYKKISSGFLDSVVHTITIIFSDSSTLCKRRVSHIICSEVMYTLSIVNRILYIHRILCPWSENRSREIYSFGPGFPKFSVSWVTYG